MIIFASDNYIQQIKLLWKQAFGDSDEAIEFYFSHVHKHENMLIDVEEGKVAAMLTMHPLKIFQNGKSISGRYIYAVATHFEFRSKGISTRLLEHAHGYMREQNVKMSILVPATRELFDFYEKRRYTRAFCVQDRVFVSDEIKEADFLYTFDLCDAQEYYSIRKKAFSNSVPFAAWDKDMLSSIMEYARFFGGEFVKISMGRSEAALYITHNGDEVFVREFAGVNMEVDCALSALHERLGAKKYIVRTAPSGMDCTDFAMVCNLKDENIIVDNAYFNLAMD